MAGNFPSPPTFANPVTVNEATGESGFNPIWLRWFLDFAQLLQQAATGELAEHNNLLLRQGGTPTESFHLTTAEHTTLVTIATATTDSTLIGRGSAAGAGPAQEIALGTGLSMVGTTLNATGSGDVVGPAGAVNNHVVFFDGATGKLIKDSGLALSGTNTGDQTSIVGITGTLAEFNAALTGADFASGGGTASGTNTGDQTTIVGITGTKAQFDTACTDGNFLYVGDVTQYTDELAQDAVGAMVDASLVYVDATPLLQRAALTGDVTAAAGGNATTIANDAVTYAKMQNVSATSRVLGRRTAGAGDPEECTTTQVLDFVGSTQGQIFYRDAAAWAVLAVGTAGQVLKTGGAAANPSWVGTKEMLANVTLGADGTSLASGTILARAFLEIHIYIEGYSGGATASLRFNGDSGANYRYRWLTSAAGATTFANGLLATSTTGIKVGAADTTNSRRVVFHISNDASVTEKLALVESLFGTGSAATQATIDQGNGAWISAAATQITSISLISTSNMLAGTKMTIFGWN